MLPIDRPKPLGGGWSGHNKSAFHSTSSLGAPVLHNDKHRAPIWVTLVSEYVYLVLKSAVRVCGGRKKRPDSPTLPEQFPTPTIAF